MGWFRRSEHPEEQLSAYLDGQLNARQASAVERHLAGCVACSALLEDLRSAKSMLAAMPRETPRRSFVLGPQYARGVPARPPRRSVLTFAPAIALTVFVALLVVDLGSFTSNSASTSHNDAAGARKTANSQAVASDSAVTAPAVQAPPREGFTPETPNAGAGAAQAPQTGAAPNGTPLTTFAAPVAPNPSLPPGVATPESAAGVTSAGAAAASSGADSVASGPNVFGSAETPAVQPVAQPANGSGSGPSTLRILEILAGAVFLSSTFFVFAWPRLKSRGDS